MDSLFVPKDAVQFLNRNSFRRNACALEIGVDYPMRALFRASMVEDMNTTAANDRTSLGIGWVTVFLGIWLVISPFVLGFAHAPAGISNNIAVGLVIIVCSFRGVKQGLLRAAIVLMGAWLYASAFILYVPVRAYLWNNLILAFAVILAAVASEA
jgi:hypothetical protein